MKKILSILLALLVLGCSSALAAPADVISLTDPSVYLLVDGETVDVDLTGLRLSLAIPSPEEAGENDNSVLIYLSADEDVLLSAALTIDSDRVTFMIDGIDGVFEIPVLVSTPDLTDDPSAFGDMMEVMALVVESLEAEELEDGTLWFHLPYDALNQMAARLLPAFIQDENYLTSDLEDMILELQTSDSGLDLEAVVYADEESDAYRVDLYGFPVSEGFVSDEPLVYGQLIAIGDDVSLVGYVFGLGEGHVFVTEVEGNLLLQLGCASDDEQSGFDFIARLEESEENLAFPALDPENAIVFEEMDEEQQDAFYDALASVLSPVAEWFLAAVD